MYEPFQALADPQRLRIVELLLAKERTVNELVAQLDIRQSGVSRHLRILEGHGFVQMRAEGTKRLYSLRSDRFVEIDRWLSRYRQLWNERLDALGDALEKKQKLRAQAQARRKK